MKIETNARLEMISDTVREQTGMLAADIIVEAERCDGCGECVTACAREMAPRGGKGEGVPRIKIREVDGTFQPLLCRNCEEAPCVTACMTGCRHKVEATGWVQTVYDRCVGCWMCIMACPFGVIERVADEHKARKCDGCTGKEIPACVAACKPGALKRGDVLSYSYSDRRRAAARTGLTPRLTGRP